MARLGHGRNHGGSRSSDVCDDLRGVHGIAC
jgi:hypothetical protein